MGDAGMRMLQVIPALPAKDMRRGVAHYRDKLGFTLIHEIPAIDVNRTASFYIVQPIGMDAPEITARFSDPAEM
jgi:catechol 2,3-dioxygenase-like lactoylglutathione lyase family enzyme